ncbi:MAG TPA: DUF2497 domain-containing protein [Caulobacteraceae bacterium]|nr:DUF2497 domain-containing protein [Caulobacteraceae bacterium]
MAEANSPEPTMEEILASIRRIISEDDAPVAEAPEAAYEPEPEPEPKAPEPVPTPEPLAAAPVEDDVLELTERVYEPEPEPAAHLDDLEVMENIPPPRPSRPTPAVSYDEEELVSGPIANSAASAFGALHRQVLMPTEGRTLEDVTRELLRPLLKAWLDEHLPAIVESAVEAEVDRISRQRR